ncbi:lysophospholipase [Asanoa ishikariensis]|uniref:Lysophospholipase L1 n=1 Tax=Asanoa ishikariensis TaxID=137265 RepID=A0A1H3UHK4_9ACTN|nr:SGNH/GDSL hydrolase family protein [Asanoa ishikariensis]GIF63496.1 lysophospholipase [Asanoa ishikariensis]SDZ61933.1 Lysophospholipase L1 [Asanoa ishikariensis]
MGETILFIGDSITDCSRGADKLGLGGGYVDAVATRLRERGDDAVVRNTGIAGNRIAHLQERWQADVLDHAPTALSVYIGVNDTLVAFWEGRPTPPKLFEERYADVLAQAVAAGVPRILLVEPFYVDTEQAAAPWARGNAFVREDLDRKRPIVRALAERFGAAFVPLQAPVDAAVAERGPAVLAQDGVHPSALGHRLIAERWLAAYDALTAPGR